MKRRTGETEYRGTGPKHGNWAIGQLGNWGGRAGSRDWERQLVKESNGQLGGEARRARAVGSLLTYGNN